MSDEPVKDVPDAMLKIIGAMTLQALARCDSLGIPRESFYRAMLKEQELHPEVSVSELFDRTFRRLSSTTN